MPGTTLRFTAFRKRCHVLPNALASYVLEHTEVQFGIFGDSDQSLNLVTIAESLADRIDPSELLMVYVQTRACFLAYHASDFYEQWGVLPLMGKLHVRHVSNGRRCRPFARVPWVQHLMCRTKHVLACSRACTPRDGVQQIDRHAVWRERSWPKIFERSGRDIRRAGE